MLWPSLCHKVMQQVEPGVVLVHAEATVMHMHMGTHAQISRGALELACTACAAVLAHALLDKIEDTMEA
jgi:hypothetical protein